MMTKVLVYGCCVGVFASRRLERRLIEDVAFSILAAGNEPDFRTWLQRIREARKALEERARAEAKAKPKDKNRNSDKDNKPGAGSGRRCGSKVQPRPEAQHNFTDPESRIMKGPDGFCARL